MSEKPPEKIYGREPTPEEIKAAEEWNYKYKKYIVGSSVVYWYLKFNGCNCK